MLRQSAPDSFREVSSTRSVFDRVRDPLIAKQLEALKKTESQRRGKQGEGSQMVKLHKPFPELRPRSEMAPKRDAFNRAWRDEQRRARPKGFDRPQQERKPSELER